MQQIVIILGMHRSGASALAGALRRLGADFGPTAAREPEGDDPGATPEHPDIVACHERLLAALRRAWDDPRGLPKNWTADESAQAARRELAALLRRDFHESILGAVKDPRLCRLVPLWLDILDDLETEPRFIIVHRPLVEIAASLERRHGFSAQKSALLWADHVLSAERRTRGHRRVFVCFDRLLRDAEATLRAVGTKLNLDWPRPLAEAAADLDAIVRPSLRHHVAGGGAPPADFGRLSAIVGPPDKILTTLGVAGDPIRTTPFDQARTQLTRFLVEADSVMLEHAAQMVSRTATERQALRARLEAQTRSLRDQQDRIAELQAEITALRSLVSDLSADLRRSVRENADALQEQVRGRLREQQLEIKEHREAMSQLHETLETLQAAWQDQASGARETPRALQQVQASAQELLVKLDETTRRLERQEGSLSRVSASVGELETQLGARADWPSGRNSEPQDRLAPAPEFHEHDGWRGVARRAWRLSGRVAQSPLRAGRAVTSRARTVWRRSVAPKLATLRRH